MAHNMTKVNELKTMYNIELQTQVASSKKI